MIPSCPLKILSKHHASLTICSTLPTEEVLLLKLRLLARITIVTTMQEMHREVARQAISVVKGTRSVFFVGCVLTGERKTGLKKESRFFDNFSYTKRKDVGLLRGVCAH